MTTTTATRAHPISGFASAASTALGRVAGAPAWSMSPEEQRSALVELARVEAQVVELRSRVLAEADRTEVGADTGASSTAAWVAHATRVTREAAGRAVRLAHALDGEFEATRAAMAAGAVNAEQAPVIIAAVSKLSPDVPDARRREAEAWLVDHAATCDATTLRVLGRRLFEVIDPDAAEAEEGKALQREEEHARRTASFSMRSNGDGTCEGRFKVPDLHAAILRKALQALVAPRRTGPARLDPATGKKTPYPVLLGQGLMELLEHLPTDRLPTAGGGSAAIVVTLDYHQLVTGLGAAGLDTGEKISAAEARRLACDASIIPVVLGGASQPLDIGRARRLHTRAQRVAITHRDQECLAENCDRPPAWTEVHHPTPWAHGGDTSVDNGTLRCPFHHRLDHDPAYTKTTLPDGQVRYRRRQ